MKAMAAHHEAMGDRVEATRLYQKLTVRYPSRSEYWTALEKLTATPPTRARSP